MLVTLDNLTPRIAEDAPFCRMCLPVAVLRPDSQRSSPVPLRITFARIQIQIPRPEDYPGVKCPSGL